MTNSPARTLVAVVGGSGSGKTWAADRLAAMLGRDACRASLDSFYRDRSHLSLRMREQVNFDHPRSIDWPLVRTFLEAYRQGDWASMPRYDFATHCRLPEPCHWSPAPVLIMDGLWLLTRREIRRLFDLSIYLDCPQKVRLRQRLARDISERGRSAASIRRQFKNRVVPMHRLWVSPQARHASLILTAPVSIRGVAHVAKMLRSRLLPSSRNRAQCMPVFRGAGSVRGQSLQL